MKICNSLRDSWDALFTLIKSVTQRIDLIFKSYKSILWQNSALESQWILTSLKASLPWPLKDNLVDEVGLGKLLSA